MTNYEVTGEVLQKMVRLGKRRPMPFAFCPSKGEDNPLFAVHRKRDPELIGRWARKESGQTRVAFGTYVVQGKLMTVTLVKELPAIAKKMKKYFRHNSLPMNVRILDISGNELESDIEDLPDIWGPLDADSPDDDDEDDEDDTKGDDGDQTPAAVAQTIADIAQKGGEDARTLRDLLVDAPTIPAQTPVAAVKPDAVPAVNDDRIRDLSKRLIAVQTGVMALGGAAGEALRKTLDAAVSLIRSGAVDGAAREISALERGLARQDVTRIEAPSGPSRPEQDRRALDLMQKLVRLRGRVEGLGAPSGATLMKAVGLAVQQVRTGDLDSAQATVSKINRAANRVSKTPESDASSPD